MTCGRVKTKREKRHNPFLSFLLFANYKKELLKTWADLPEIYITSAEKKEGGDKVLDFIDKTNVFLVNNHVDFNG